MERAEGVAMGVVEYVPAGQQHQRQRSAEQGQKRRSSS